MKKIRNIIISGYSRSGTTYLFHLLKSHGYFDIAKNNTKEVRYFIDKDYYLQFKSNSISYLSNYLIKNRYTLDSSPDYIHNSTFVEEFKSNINIKTIIIKRPIDDRLKSWYNYSRSKNIISKKISLKDFIDNQITNEDSFNNPPHYSIISNMKYRDYLNELIKIDDTRVLVIDFLDLTNNFEKICPKLSKFLELKISMTKNLKIPKNSSHDVSLLNSLRFFRFIKNFLRRKL